MTSDDLKKLQECKTELFEGIGQVLAGIGLEHLEVAGLELEPSSVKIGSDQLDFEKGGEGVAEESDCEKNGGRLVWRVNPQTGKSFSICIPKDSAI